MRVVRGTRLRTLLATLAVASMMISIGELRVADVHDGDAPAADSTSLASQGVSSTTFASSTEGSTDPSQPEHTYHVCHCGHAHCGMLSIAAHSPVRRPVLATGFAKVAAANATTIADRPTRPPIA